MTSSTYPFDLLDALQTGCWLRGVLEVTQARRRQVRHRLRLRGKNRICHRWLPSSMVARGRFHGFAEPGLRALAVGGDRFVPGVLAVDVNRKGERLFLADSGRLSWVDVTDLRPMCAQADQPWSEVPAVNAIFVRDILCGRRPMLILTLGQRVQVELNGKWMTATVTDLKGPLARMKFPSGACVWVHRASTRFAHIFRVVNKREGQCPL